MTHDSNNLKTPSAAPAGTNENDVEALLGAIREIQNRHLDQSPVARRICDGLYVLTLLPVVAAALACLGVAFLGTRLARAIARVFRRRHAYAHGGAVQRGTSKLQGTRTHGHAVAS